MEQKPFGWCFIGTGTLAGNVVRDVMPSGRHRVVSCFSRNPEKCGAFAAQAGAKACGSIEEAIDAPGVDGVYVVTPHPAHYEAVRLALSHGKPVLCEKPMCVNEADAKALFALAGQKRVYLAEAMWTWFAPTANKVKAWLDAGRFGTVRSVTANYHMNGQGYAPRVTDPKQAGGAVLDIGVYPIHYLVRLFGMPESVRCTGRLLSGIDMGEEIELCYENGLVARSSVAIDNFKGLERFTLRGSDASVSIFLFHMANGAKLKKGLRTLDRVRGSGGYLNEFDLVAGEIREGLTESRFVPPYMTLNVLRIVDECRRQMGLVYPFEQ